MCFVSLLVTVTYVCLLRWIAKPIIYGSLFAIFILGVLAGYYVYLKREDYEPGTANNRHAFGAAYAIWVITFIYTIFVCCQWNNIALGASIMEAASDFVSSN